MEQTYTPARPLDRDRSVEPDTIYAVTRDERHDDDTHAARVTHDDKRMRSTRSDDRMPHARRVPTTKQALTTPSQRADDALAPWVPSSSRTGIADGEAEPC